MRYHLVRSLLDIPAEVRTRLDVIQTLEEARQLVPPEQAKLLPKSPQTVYRWLSDYKKSQEDIRSLIPGWKQSGGPGKSKVRGLPDLIDAVVEQRYLVPERPTIQHVTDLVMSQLHHDNKFRDETAKIPVPKPHALYMLVARRIAKVNTREVVAKRHGDRAARHRYDGVGQAPPATRVLERVLIDHTRLDLFIVDETDRLPIGRPTVTFCIDSFSSYPLGIYVGFEPPSVLTVMHSLRNAMVPKIDLRSQYPNVVHEWASYGVPESIVVDNGKEFIGNSMADACLQLGIELIQSPVRAPEFKGAVERWFSTMNKQLLHNLPGTTFSNVMDRADYDPASTAVITLSAFLEMLHIFIVDYYAQRPTSAGFVPALRWKEGCKEYPPALPLNQEELLVLLGAFTERTIRRQGIEFECLIYQSPDLTVLRTRLDRGRVKEPAKVKYDPADLGRLWVFDRFEQQWIEVPCTDRNYTAGLSLWKHQVIKRYARQELGHVDYVALADAKAKIQAIIDREYSETKRTATRNRLHRFRSGGFDSTRIKLTGESGQPVDSPRSPEPVADAQQDAPARQGRRRQQRPAEPGSSAAAVAPKLSIPDEEDLDLGGWRSSSGTPKRN
jgi:putative transposase